MVGSTLENTAWEMQEGFDEPDVHKEAQKEFEERVKVEELHDDFNYFLAREAAQRVKTFAVDKQWKVYDSYASQR